MSQIRCPHCNQVFTIDKSEYQELLDQVRNETLKEELKEREKQLEEKYIERQNAQLSAKETAFQKELNALHLKLQEAETKINAAETQKQLEVSKANEESQRKLAQTKEEEIKKQQELEKTIADLNAKLKTAEANEKVAVMKAREEETQKQNDLSNKLKEAELKLQNFDQAKASEIELVKAKQEAEIEKIRGEMRTQQSEAELEKKKLQEMHENEIRLKDEQIAQYKDFKLSLSTKMIGESLEQYCYNEFNKVRMGYPLAKFEKDNLTPDGTKGDFIYRETDENGIEILSIMFEMKNEADDTVVKHKNEGFFDKLNKDRNDKKCEYAVLVTTLEKDNDYYNGGIVDVSYAYPKMYVVRPQCFLPLIAVLHQAAMKSIQTKRELELVKQEQLDVTHFEEKLDSFKNQIGRNFELAGKKYASAIADIDKAIAALQKTREELVSSEKYLKLGTDQTQGITIRKLTNGNPTMKKLFEDAQEKRDNTIDVEEE